MITAPPPHLGEMQDMTTFDSFPQASLQDVSTRAELAEALSSLRLAAGLTVRQVADAIDVPASTVGGYFSGRHLPPVSQPDQFTNLLRTCGVTDDRELAHWQEVLNEIRRTPGPRPEGEPAPYRGLASYRTEDSEWFFGRVKLTYSVVTRLQRSWTEGEGPVAIVGPSGSGKSSLIAAGVIPALGRDDFSGVAMGDWPTMMITPGRDPVRALASALADVTGSGVDDIARELRHDPTRAVRYAESAASSAGATGVLLVVDQLEEAFTETRDEADRETLLAAVHAISAHDPHGSDGPAGAVVLGLRADFYHRALGEPLLLPVLQRNQVAVGPMSESDLREIIVEPARRAHVEVEPGLAEVIVRDLTPSLTHDGGLQDAGALPLLSHTLLATWEHSSGGRMTLAHYQTTGGVHGSVASTADAVLDSMDESERAIARRLLVHLVRVTDDAPYTRRRLLRGERAEYAGPDVGDDQLAAVLDRLVDQRLITIDSDAVQITHESLVVAWPRLRGWVDADRQRLLTGQRLQDAARAWLREARDSSLLYRGSMLNAARDWVNGGGAPGATAREFLDASQRRERRRVRRLYGVIGALCVLTLVAAAGGLYAYEQRAEAVAQREDATAARMAATEERNAALSRMLAISSDRLAETDPVLARQLALVAYETSPTLEARSGLLSTSSGPTVTRMLGPDGIMNAIAMNSAGSVLAGGAGDGSVRLWDVTSGNTPTELVDSLPGVSGPVNAIAFHPDDEILAVAGGAERVVLFDVADESAPDLLGELTGPEAALNAVEFSPDGTTIAAAGLDEQVWMWDVSDPSSPAPMPRPLSAPDDSVTSLAFSPDGNQLAAGSYDRSVHRWNTNNPAKPDYLGHLDAPELAVFDVTYSPDGSTLAAASADQHVYRWELDGDDASLVSPELSGPTSWVNEVTFSPDGATIAAAASDGLLWTWDAASGSTSDTLPHGGPLTDVTFEADGQAIYTAGEDGIVRRWRVPGPTLTGPTDAVHDVTFHPTEPIATLASGDGGVYLWDLTDPRRPVPAADPLRSGDEENHLIGAATFNPSGDVLAAAGLDGRVWRWDTSDPAEPTALSPLSGLDTYAERLAYSPDGTLLAGGAADGSVAIWDVSDPAEPELLTTLDDATTNVIAVTFSPDGRTLAVGGVDTVVWLYDVTDPAEPVLRGEPLTGPANAVYWLTFDPSGDNLAIGSADGTVRLWDVTDVDQPVEGPVLRGPDGYVVGIDFSPSGDTLAAASTDHSVWVWDTSDITEPSLQSVLSGADAAMHAVSYDHSGQTLVAAGQGATGHIWHADVEQVADHICDTSGDPITEGEWEQHVPGLPYTPPC